MGVVLPSVEEVLTCKWCFRGKLLRHSGSTLARHVLLFRSVDVTEKMIPHICLKTVWLYMHSAMVNIKSSTSVMVSSYLLAVCKKCCLTVKPVTAGRQICSFV